MQACPARTEVHLETGVAIRRCRPVWCLRSAAQQRPYACQQLSNPEWLRDVVVGSQIQGADLVTLTATARKHHHRRLQVTANRVEDLQSIRAWQTDAKQQQVERMLRDQLERLRPIGRRMHVVPTHLEIAGD